MPPAEHKRSVVSLTLGLLFKLLGWLLASSSLALLVFIGMWLGWDASASEGYLNQLLQDQLHLIGANPPLIHRLVVLWVTYVPSWLVESKILLSALKLILLRVETVVLMLPLFLLLGVVGFIDGLLQRHLRRLKGGRESTLIYHRAKAGILPFFFWSGFLYVTIPLHYSPDYLFVPFAGFSALCIFLTTKTFKKYL